MMVDANRPVVDYKHPGTSEDPEPREVAAMFAVGILALVVLGMFVVIATMIALVQR